MKKKSKHAVHSYGSDKMQPKTKRSDTHPCVISLVCNRGS